jgi:uncharacterized protein (TIGR02452 family)
MAPHPQPKASLDSGPTIPGGSFEAVPKKDTMSSPSPPLPPSSVSSPKASKAFEAPDPNPQPLPRESRGDISAEKRWRVEVWRSTDTLLGRGYFVNSRGQRIPLESTSLQPLVRAVPGGKDRVVHPTPSKAPATLLPRPMRVTVQNVDCVDAAVRLYDQGLNPILMNAASRGHFGGGYKGGSRAQEEELCRRSALAYVVHPLEKRFYPLKPEDGIYVPPIPFFRKGASEDYQLMDRAVPIAVGIVSAFNKPPLIENETKLSREVELATIEMIKTFFRMARDNGHRSVIPVALGCGAFRNPAIHLSKLFFSVLETFNGCFDEVVFAVLDDHNAYHEHNPLGNFAAFGITCLGYGGAVLRDDGTPMTEEELRAHAACFSRGGGRKPKRHL